MTDDFVPELEYFDIFSKNYYCRRYRFPTIVKFLILSK